VKALSEKMEAFKEALAEEIAKELLKELKSKPNPLAQRSELGDLLKEMDERDAALQRLDQMLQEQNLMLQGLRESRRELNSPLNLKKLKKSGTRTGNMMRSNW